MNNKLLFPAIRDISHKMAHCANYAYWDGKEAKPLYKSRGFTHHKFFDKNGSQAHVVWNASHIAVCFRGTEPTEVADLKADLNIWPDDAMVGGWVHNGFQNALDEIWDDIVKHLGKHTNKKLLICGHSLGGAMATVAASRLKDLNPTLFTFGSPRVGNAIFVKQFSNVTHYRFVNNNDIVTAIPMWFLGYRHHGTCIYIDYTGAVSNLTAWRRTIDKFKGKWRALRKGQPFDGLYDHNCLYYCLYTSNHEESDNAH